MDEIELIVIGAVFAASLSVSEAQFHERVQRVSTGLLVTCVTGFALFLLHLSISHDPSDFLAADFGVVLVTGVYGVGGLLPRSVWTEHSRSQHWNA